MKTTSYYLVSILAASLAVACGAGSDELTGGRSRGGADDLADGDGTGGDGTDGAPDPAQCTSRAYAGFGGRNLNEARKTALMGVDRGRVKPFTALQGEYSRVLGAAPASLQGAGPTFGDAPKTWFEEPQSNAVALQTAYGIAFDGCIGYTAKPEFDAAPDATSAAAKCSAMARAFWSKTPSPDEIQGCVDVATKATASEPQARRKWAYACASVLTSAGFMTY